MLILDCLSFHVCYLSTCFVTLLPAEDVGDRSSGRKPNARFRPGPGTICNFGPTVDLGRRLWRGRVKTKMSIMLLSKSVRIVNKSIRERVSRTSLKGLLYQRYSTPAQENLQS